MRKISWLTVLLVMQILLAHVSWAQEKPQPRKIPVARVETTAELAALLKRAQATIEQMQADGERVRLQNDTLQKVVSQNSEELATLRQAIADIGVQLAALRKEKENATAATAAQLAAVTPALTNTQTEIKTLQNDLEHIKEQADVHTAQLKEHAQTKVESESKSRVKFYGTILSNTYLNTANSALDDVPLFAPPPGSTIRKNNVGSTLRQTKLGFLFNGITLSDKLGSPRASAEAEFDFWGGEDTDVTGMMRIVTASVRVDWDRTSIIAGQKAPFISPRNPSSLGAVWFPSFTSAGNLWQWRPQIIVEHRIAAGEHTEWQLQGGLMSSFGENVQGAVIEGAPGYEGRVGFSHTLASENKLAFGLGTYIHRRPFALGRSVNSYALTSDWAIPLGEKFELSGEAYLGRAINLADGAGFRADRHYAITGALSDPLTKIRGVFELGGWTQFTYKARPDLDFNFAYGQEDPRNRDLFFGPLSASTRFKNQSASTNFIWNWRQNFLLSLEYRRFWTNYAAATRKSGQYNLAIGYTF